MDSVKVLAGLERRREIECRLTSDRALAAVDEAASFLSDRGLMTRMQDSSLPSLFAACHEEPSRPGGRGFDLWPKTKWIWSFQLAPDHALITKLHRGKTLYLSREAALIFDPMVRQGIDNATGDDARLLEHLHAHGGSTLHDVELELGWDRRRLKRTRERLERIGAVISDGLVFEDQATWYMAPLRRWDQAVAASPRRRHGDEPIADVVVAGVRAAVLTRESDVHKWFSWDVPPRIVDDLVEAGRLLRPSPGWLTHELTAAEGQGFEPWTGLHR
jgi:hypothetical protein